MGARGPSGVSYPFSGDYVQVMLCGCGPTGDFFDLMVLRTEAMPVIGEDEMGNLEERK